MGVQNKRKSLSQAERQRLIQRDQYRCQICTKPFMQLPNGRSICEVDHMLALTNGGSNDRVMLRCVHPDCHALKTAFDVNPVLWEQVTGLSKYFTGPLASSSVGLSAYYKELSALQTRLTQQQQSSDNDKF